MIFCKKYAYQNCPILVKTLQIFVFGHLLESYPFYSPIIIFKMTKIALLSTSQSMLTIVLTHKYTIWINGTFEMVQDLIKILFCIKVTKN